MKRALPVAVAITVTGVALTAAHAGAAHHDSTAPPAPVISNAPPNPTTVGTATFTFTDAEKGVRFECRAGEQSRYTPCTSPARHSGFAKGLHIFRVRAVDAAGNHGVGRSFSWTVAATVRSFEINGHVEGHLTRGATARVNVMIANPYGYDIVVRGLKVTPKKATTTGRGAALPGCDGAKNLKAAAYTGPPITVRANERVTLADRGIPRAQWPQLTMPTLTSGADPCTNATFSFSYSAHARKA